MLWIYQSAKDSLQGCHHAIGAESPQPPRCFSEHSIALVFGLIVTPQIRENCVTCPKRPQDRQHDTQLAKLMLVERMIHDELRGVDGICPG